MSDLQKIGHFNSTVNISVQNFPQMSKIFPKSPKFSPSMLVVLAGFRDSGAGSGAGAGPGAGPGAGAI